MTGVFNALTIVFTATTGVFNAMTIIFNIATRILNGVYLPFNMESKYFKMVRGGIEVLIFYLIVQNISFNMRYPLCGIMYDCFEVFSKIKTPVYYAIKHS